MTVSIENLRYADPTNTLIDMSVAGWIEGETIPFTYHPGDTAPLAVEIGEMLAAGEYEIAAYVAAPPPVPKSITRFQSLAMLVRKEFITQAEANAANVTIPAGIQAIIDTLPPDQRGVAQVKFLNYLDCMRTDTLFNAAADARGFSEADKDDFFREGALIS